MKATDNIASATLKSEIMLQINRKLLEQGVISEAIYKAAVSKILSKLPEA